MQTYTFTHKGKYETDNETFAFLSSLGAQDVFFHEVPLNPKRIGFMNSLSDSINNVVIERQSGASWEQFRYTIITPDGHMEREIRNALARLGVDDGEIFTEGIPENVRVGLNKNADDFMSPFRYAMPLDGGGAGAPSYEWRHNPALRLLRVRDTSPGYPKEPYPAWGPGSPEARTAIPEAYLSDDLTALVYAVAEAWGQPCADLGCTGITFDNGEVWAVIGTLGTKTGNATYVGLGLNNFRSRLGAKNVAYTRLEQSASPEFYGDIDNLDKLFVYYFARDCSRLESLTHGYCAAVEDSELVVPAGDRAAFTERDYMVPGTLRGPDSSKLLPSRALKLARPW